jgi:hypothetical protein
MVVIASGQNVLIFVEEFAVAIVTVGPVCRHDGREWMGVQDFSIAALGFGASENDTACCVAPRGSEVKNHVGH